MTSKQEFFEAMQETVSDLEGEDQKTLDARRRVRGGPTVNTLRFVERDQVLFVDDRARRVRGEQPWQINMAAVARGQVGAALEKLDQKLTPNQGIRRFDGAKLVKIQRPDEGRTLLLVHGTFSNNDNLLGSIRRGANGDDFLRWASEHYAQVLTFDHATLQVSPMLNAMAISRIFDGFPSPIDVLCHSRGGLVVRWWLDEFDRGDPAMRRAVFVGSPLAGTGLAAPPRLRATLGLMSNIAKVLGAGSAAVPFMTFAAGIFNVVASITTFASKTPAIDAAVALVPGLFAQSRVGNNQEILSARRAHSDWDGRYFAVQSNFEPPDEGWKFWRYFRRMGDRAKDAVADIVFDGANDLVVDSPSMKELGDHLVLPDEQVYNFGTSETVHHNNYLEQPDTLAFIRQSLGR